MARIAEIEDRLLRWAEYFKSGDTCGYPVKSTLHEDWSPPSPGMTPSMRVAPANDAPQTHRMVARLSERLQATLVAVDAYHNEPHDPRVLLREYNAIEAFLARHR